MSQFCGVHRPPRAGVDQIDSAAAALAVIRLVVHQPLQPEVIVLVLDADRRGRTVVLVDGTDEPDSVLEVVERIAESAADSELGAALVVASVRPGSGPLDGDDERWLEACDLADGVGVELLEWFVISDDTGPTTAWCPRDLLADPPRWPRAS